MRSKPLQITTSMVWAATLLLLAASACSMPLPATPTPVIAVELTPDAIYTAAVQTVVAQLTENAPTPIPTETQPPPEATFPTVDTPLPTPAESATPLPSETPTIAPTAQPEPSETPQPSDPVLELGPPTWQETFETGEGWTLVSDSHSHFEVVNGQMVMTSYNADYWNSWALTQLRIEVFYLEAEAVSGTCAGRDRWGLFFRAPDYSRGYLYGLSCDGRFALWAWNGFQEVYLVDWTESPHILKGPEQVNRIGVKADGSRLSLYANGHLVNEIRDDSYSSGRFGLFVGASDTPGFTVKADKVTYWENP